MHLPINVDALLAATNESIYRPVERISVTLDKEGVVYPQPDPTPGVTDPAGWRTGKADPDDASARAGALFVREPT